MVIEIEQVLSRDEVRQFRARLDQAQWQDGQKTAGTLAARVKRNLQLDDGSETAQALGNHILRRLGSHPQFISAALPARIYPPKFNCYTGGGHYGAHIDSALMHVPGTAQTVRTDLSATLFLCEPDEYDGGELSIEGPAGLHKEKLAAGNLVLYPSTTLHHVTPVTRGARIASFFWIQSMVRDNHQRELLYGLDQSVQRLTAELGGDHAEVVRLSGLYHNLLRVWAET
jgi:PKHD-type hydroxylase